MNNYWAILRYENCLPITIPYDLEKHILTFVPCNKCCDLILIRNNYYLHLMHNFYEYKIKNINSYLFSSAKIKLLEENYYMITYKLVQYLDNGRNIIDNSVYYLQYDDICYLYHHISNIDNIKKTHTNQNLDYYEKLKYDTILSTINKIVKIKTNS